jgi:hypothetical protein
MTVIALFAGLWVGVSVGFVLGGWVMTRRITLGHAQEPLHATTGTAGHTRSTSHLRIVEGTTTRRNKTWQ